MRYEDMCQALIVEVCKIKFGKAAEKGLRVMYFPNFIRVSSFKCVSNFHNNTFLGDITKSELDIVAKSVLESNVRIREKQLKWIMEAT